jgi:endo-1,3(4)-beta-glucanase
MELLMNNRNRKRVTSFAARLAVCSLLAGMVPAWQGSTVHAEEEDYLLSLNRPVYASSVRDGNTADLAIDGDTGSRWESAWQKDQQWLYVDLGAQASVSEISVVWENAYSKSFELQVSNDEREWKSVYATTDGKGGTTEVDVSEKARYVRVYSHQRAMESYGVSIREFSVYGTGGANVPPKPAAPNLALGKAVTVSSLEINDPGKSEEDKSKMESKNYAAAGAVDSSRDTRWSSVFKDNEWIYVDLGETKEIGGVVLDWETAYGRAYDIQVSSDAQDWTTLYRELSGNGGREEIPVYANTRYVKLAGIGRGSSNGYSLYEFGVHAYRAGDAKPSYSIPDIPAPSAVALGAGSYEINDITQLQPKNPKYRTENVQTPIPSNDWWQSILINNLGNSNGIVTLPFKNWYTKQGLAVLNPGAGFAAADGGSINADGPADLFLTASTINPANAVTKVSGYGDFSASVVMSDDDTAKMETNFVKGSPFLFNTFDNPDAVIINASGITGLFDDHNQPILTGDGEVITADHIGIEITNQDKAPVAQTFVRHYGVFAPEGTVFMKLGNTIKLKLPQGSNYVSLAALTKAEDLSKYYQHAYAFVTDTRVDYQYDQADSMVTTTFKSVTEAKRPGFSTETLMALLPHQWKVSPSTLTDLSYPSIRGELKVREGSSFTTADRFFGIIPQFVEPGNKEYSRAQLLAYLDQLDADISGQLMIADPYWQGKKLHPIAMGVLISDQIGDSERKDRYLATLKTILTDWYTYSPDEPKHSYYFHYAPQWGAVFPYASGFGVNTGLTDHHFTYGYYLFASAVLGTYDDEFVTDYGDMVELLLRDYANPSRTDSMFPWFRNFDPYEGHSWAGGYADNQSGNNQEAAGEALFSWVGQYLWGLVTDNDTYRDAGIWGFTTEVKAAEQYWFNFDGDNWAPGYKHKTAGMVFGSAYLYGTYFSGDPESIYGIHWLPTAEWLSYYGRYPEKAAELYAGMVEDVKATGKANAERSWQHIIWPMHALSDPGAVLAKWDSSVMQQNEVFNAYWFVNSMAALGSRSTDIWSDDPAVTVYEKQGSYTAQIWNPSDQPKTVRFFNEAGQTGSATVYAKATAAVDPLKNTVVNKPDTPENPTKYVNSDNWVITASSSSEPTVNMTDGNLATRWSSGRLQSAGDWIKIDLGQEEQFDTLFMNSGTSWGDYAHGYEVYVSADGQEWGSPLAAGKGTAPSLVVSLSEQKARYVKVILTAPADSWWSVAELKLGSFGKPASSGPKPEEPKPDEPKPGEPTHGPVNGTGELKDRSNWVITASSSQEKDGTANMVDGDVRTRWTSGKKQTNGQWLVIDLGKKQAFDSIALDQSKSPNDYPRSYKVYVSDDGTKWSGAIAGGKGTPKLTSITFPKQEARYIRIVQTGEDTSWWTVSDLRISNYGLGRQKQVKPEGWSVTASSGSNPGVVLEDNDSRWTSGKEQAGGEWLQLDLGKPQAVARIVMDSAHSQEDYARGYEVYLSSDETTWGDAVAVGQGRSPFVEAAFPLQTARYIKVVQTAKESHWWSISNITLYTADLTPWTPGQGVEGPEALDRFGWKVTASVEKDKAALIDGDLHTRWTTEKGQQPDQWLQLDLGSIQSFSSIRMDSKGSDNDYARGYEILVSTDGTSWSVAAKGSGASSTVQVELGKQSARYVKILQTANASQHWWSIVELNLYR